MCRSFPSSSNLASTKASFYLHQAPLQAAKLQCFFLFFNDYNVLLEILCSSFVFSLPLRSNKGLPFIDEKLHTLSKNTEEIEANISMAGGNLNVFDTGGIRTGSSHSIWFDLPQILPFFSHNTGVLHEGTSMPLCRNQFVSLQTNVQYVFVWQHRCVSWHLEWLCWKDLPWRSSLFFVYLGFIVRTCLECKIWQKGYQSHYFKESVPRKLINLFLSATISPTT